MMHDQMPAVMIAHSTILEPVRKEISDYEIDPWQAYFLSGRHKVNNKCQSAHRGGFIFKRLTFPFFCHKTYLGILL